MFQYMFHIKAYIVLTIVFLFIKFSTQNFQLVFNNERYEEYSIRNLPNGYVKLSLKQFYDSAYNIQYRQFEDLDLTKHVKEDVEKDLKNNNKKNLLRNLMNFLERFNDGNKAWCDTSFISWQAFKQQVDDVSVFNNHAHNLMACLKKIQKLYKSCIGNPNWDKSFFYDYVYKRPTNPRFKTQLEDCIYNKLENDEHKNLFHTCSRQFQNDVDELNLSIQINEKSLDPFKNLFENKDIKFLDGTEKEFISCIGDGMRITVRDCFGKKSEIKTVQNCLNQDLTTSEKKKFSNCSGRLEKSSKFPNIAAVSLSGLTETIYQGDVKNIKSSKEFFKTINFRTIYVIARLTECYETNPTNLYEVYTGINLYPSKRDDIKACKSTVSITKDRYFSLAAEYIKYPEYEETFEHYQKRINDGRTTEEKFNRLKSDDIIEDEEYLQYMIRIKKKGGPNPLPENVWKEEKGKGFIKIN